MRVAMYLLCLINNFLEKTSRIANSQQLSGALAALSRRIGFAYCALTNHVDFGSSDLPGIRLHNYPSDLIHYFGLGSLGVRDSGHRASQTRGSGFPSASLLKIIKLDRDDRDVFERARRAGIGEGCTVPFRVPGEYSGSCSFSTEAGTRMRDKQIPYALLLGSFASEAARRLHGRRCSRPLPAVALTRQQRQCMVWVGHGSEWKVANFYVCTFSCTLGD